MGKSSDENENEYLRGDYVDRVGEREFAIAISQSKLRGGMSLFLVDEDGGHGVECIDIDGALAVISMSIRNAR